ncbi:MAG: hypothetical protein ACAH59_11265 [Pseudobdellovibrionaceae bacterium]
MKKSLNQKPDIKIHLLTISGLVFQTLSAWSAETNMSDYKTYSQSYTKAYFAHLGNQNQQTGTGNSNSIEIQSLRNSNLQIQREIENLQNQLTSIGSATVNLTSTERDTVVSRRRQIFSTKQEISQIFARIQLYSSSEEISNRRYFDRMKNEDRADQRDSNDENGWNGFQDQSLNRLDRRLQDLRREERWALDQADQADRRISDMRDSSEGRSVENNARQSLREMDRLTSDLQKIGSRLDSLKSDQKNIQAEIKSLETQVASLASTLANLQSQKSKVQNEFDSLRAEQKAFDLKGTLKALQKEMEQAQAEAEALTKEYGEMIPGPKSRPKDEIRKDIKANLEKRGKIEQASKDARKKADAIDDAVNDKKSELSRIDSKVSELASVKDRLTETKSRASQLPSLIQEAEKSLITIQAQLGPAKQRADRDLDQVRRFEEFRLRPLQMQARSAREAASRKSEVAQSVLNDMQEIQRRADRIRTYRSEISRVWDQALSQQTNSGSQEVLNRINQLQSQHQSNLTRMKQLEQNTGSNGGTYKSVKDWENYLLNALKFQIIE